MSASPQSCVLAAEEDVESVVLAASDRTLDGFEQQNGQRLALLRCEHNRNCVSIKLMPNPGIESRTKTTQMHLAYRSANILVASAAETRLPPEQPQRDKRLMRAS